LVLIALVIAGAVALPFVASGYQTFQLSQVVIYAIALLGLNILTGVNGQISLGHGAFFAIGGYVAAILIVKFGAPYILAIPVAGLVCFGAGFLFGLPALRLGGLYLALATFALALATPQLLKFKAFDAYTGGVQGLLLTKPKAPIGIPLTRDQWLYFVCLAFAIPLFWAAANLVHSRIGRALIAIRDHPIAAETMGVDASLYKTTTFGLSAAYTGVAGALMSLIVGFVSPDSFGLFLSLSFVVGIVVGGLASIPGVVVGALFIEFIPNVADRISDVIGESAKALPWAIYGVLLILIMYAAPSGAAGVATKLAQAVVRRRGAR
jgi:branched-chain amino acid transport system permease protein